MNKYQSKLLIKASNSYLDYLIDPKSQGVNIPFALSFGNNTDRTEHTRCYFPTKETKDYNVMIDARNLFDQSVKKQFKNIW